MEFSHGFFLFLYRTTMPIDSRLYFQQLYKPPPVLIVNIQLYIQGYKCSQESIDKPQFISSDVYRTLLKDRSMSRRQLSDLCIIVLCYWQSYIKAIPSFARFISAVSSIDQNIDSCLTRTAAEEPDDRPHGKFSAGISRCHN